ncbi:MAG TPA: sensor histidine kinase [Bryobacteraceae bacterium]|jgi:signal transduction histidine kinase
MRTLVRVLAIGFTAVILLLAAAAIIGANNARSIAQSASDLVASQLVATRLLHEVELEQRALEQSFYRLSRSPETVDRSHVLADLDQTDREIEQLVDKAGASPDHQIWLSLQRATRGFSNEARELLNSKKLPETKPLDLFSAHEEVTYWIATLVDISYARALDTERRIHRQEAQLKAETTWLVGGALVLALVCAVITVRIAASVLRQREAQAGEISRVSFRMLEIQESVARRFSHELHDELGGALTAIKTDLAFLGSDPSNRSRLDDCVKLVEQAISNVRELSQLLRPTILDDFGLDASLRWLVASFHERTGVEVDYQSTFEGRLPDETETHLFRIVQEALTNIARHSGATRVSISLRADDGAVRLRISDNGRGLAADRRNGMGLSGIRARASSFGGEVKIESKPGSGVSIDVRAPNEARAGTTRRSEPFGTHERPAEASSVGRSEDRS